MCGQSRTASRTSVIASMGSSAVMNVSSSRVSRYSMPVSRTASRSTTPPCGAQTSVPQTSTTGAASTSGPGPVDVAVAGVGSRPWASGKSAGIGAVPLSTGAGDEVSGSGVIEVVEHGSAEKTHMAPRVVGWTGWRGSSRRWSIASSPPAEPYVESTSTALPTTGRLDRAQLAHEPVVGDDLLDERDRAVTEGVEVDDLGLEDVLAALGGRLRAGLDGVDERVERGLRRRCRPATPGTCASSSSRRRR